MVAVSGTILSLVIVESGLFFSIGLAFSGRPLYNAYLWLRDLFSSEKIKNQNKDFKGTQHQLLELEKLAEKKSGLIEKINYQLNKALNSFPNKFFSEKKDIEFQKLSLKKQIQQLQQKRQELPAFSRRKKDQQISDEINEYWKYYMLGLVLLGTIIIFIELLYPPICLLVPPTMVLLFIPIAVAIAFGPVTVSNIVRETYLFLRNLFSSTAIKAENKQLIQLEKTIDKLTGLEIQLKQITKTILSKLGLTDVLIPSAELNKAQSFSEDSKNISDRDNHHQYRPLFSEVPVVPANQPVNDVLSGIPSLTS